ncbi:MAG: hypothetical protein K5637_05645 [Lachnospiraceae bacterium]|nr:hypothetical protein [Lachnospiraceae bacterium]
MKNSIIIRNMKAHKGRTLSRALLTMLLFIVIFGGTLAIMSLKRGLSSVNERFGADVMVVSRQASLSIDKNTLILQGADTYYYMDASVLDKINTSPELEGKIGKISPQFYLTSESTNLADDPVPFIGIDPSTDFVVGSWIEEGEQLSTDPSAREIIAGSGISLERGQQVSFYGVVCTVKAKLGVTGTEYDGSIFASMDTINAMINAANGSGTRDFGNLDAKEQISSILIKSDEFAVAEEITGEINLHVRGVKAVQAGGVMTNLADSVSGASTIITILLAAAVILILAVMAAAYVMSTQEQRSESALLRMLGASRKTVVRNVMGEAAASSACGIIAGAVICLALSVPFISMMKKWLGLPFLMPGTGSIAILFVISAAAAFLAAAAASGISARHFNAFDPGMELKRSI